jgi:lysophospholipase L1-like esterase
MMINRNQFGFTSVLMLVAVVAIIGFLAVASNAPVKNNLLSSIFPKKSSFAAVNVNPMPIISRGVPAFASSGTASQGNDASYTTYWRSNGAGWLAYNLSAVPAAKRGRVILSWNNDPVTSPYQHTYATVNEVAYNLPGNYTIEANPAAGGTSAPTSGWVVLATVTSNKYHSRSHQIDLTGYNWVRINVTAVDGSAGNMDININMDLFDASVAMDDSWIFFGDSITQDGMHHEPINSTNNFAQLINAANPAYFPQFEDAGIGSTATADGAAHIGTGSPNWLATFPGKYVSLAYGTNNDCNNPTAFYNDYKTMTTAVISAGKVPVVPKFPHSTALNTACFQNLINKIDQLYTDTTIVNGKTLGSQIIKGPDFWNTQLTFRDGLHPTDAGYIIMRNAWRDTMLANVYGNAPISPVPTPSVASSPIPSPSITASPSPTGGTTFSALRVSAGKILNAQNQVVHLHGVNHAGTEYACIQGWGTFDTPDDNFPNVSAIKAWNINSVLIPINEDCWLGINGVSASLGGTNYQNKIQAFVNALLANDIHPVISLMWTAPGTQQALDHATMSNMDHSPAAWTSIANKFKGDDRIMFRLLQEPHPTAGNTTAGWNCWLNGGANGVNGCNEGFTVAGTQTLLTAVRNTGATNIVWVSGVDYANSFDQFLTHKPVDPLNNMGAAADVYMDLNPCKTTACWDANYKPIITAGIPFIAGEFGESVNANVCSVTNSNTFMDWMDNNGASGYLAWLWNTWGTSCGELSLITNFNGTAHSPNGTNYKTRLTRFAAGASPVATPTLSPTPTVSILPSPSAKPGDIDGNGNVNIFDYNILLTNFGKTGTGIQGDLNNSGKVDIFDYNILLTNFGK